VAATTSLVISGIKDLQLTLTSCGKEAIACSCTDSWQPLVTAAPQRVPSTTDRPR